MGRYGINGSSSPSGGNLGGKWSQEDAEQGMNRGQFVGSQSLSCWCQVEGKTGPQTCDYTCTDDVPSEYLEARQTGFGAMTAVQHSAFIEGG